MLLLLDSDRIGLVKLGREPLPGALPQGLFDELAGSLARRTGKAFGDDGGTILRPRGDQGKQIGRSSHPDDVIALMNAPMKYEPLKK